MQENNKIVQLLPGFNCGACGFTNCSSFAAELAAHNVSANDCPVLQQSRFKKNKSKLQELIKHHHVSSPKLKPKGLIDGIHADFLLHPLENEPSCRETLVCFVNTELKKNAVIRYRPLGCPITHFAQIIETNKGLIDIWVIGPGTLLNRTENVYDLGICMVLSFQGSVEGNFPKVGQTVKFLPADCMMGKVHSGVVVQCQDNTVRIDCIDLKTWQHAKL